MTHLSIGGEDLELYPLIEKHPEVLRSKTGRKLEDITIDNIMSGEIGIDDVSISKETLILQAEVARQAGRIQLAQNFIRAAELISIPDDEILHIYNKLRPYRSTEEELVALANKLETQYEAKVCAGFVRDTLEVYKKRDILK